MRKISHVVDGAMLSTITGSKVVAVCRMKKKKIKGGRVFKFDKESYIYV